MKFHITIQAITLSLLLFSCNNDEVQPYSKISFEQVELLSHVLPPGYYSKIQCTSHNTAYTISNTGKIFKTTNGGSIWIQQTSGTDLPLNAIHFIDDLHGFIVGGNDTGVVLKTIDGGKAWLSTTFQTGLSDIYFLTDSIGYVVGGSVFRTSNGGKTWNEIDLGYLSYGKICFFNNEIGLLTAMIPGTLERVVLKTVDGGTNWIRLNTISLELYTLSKIQLVNGSAYLITLGDKVFKTNDKGTTWQIVEDPGLNSACFLNEKQAVGGGQWWYDLGFYPNGVMYLTNDGGKNWEDKHTYGIDYFYSIEDIALLNDSIALAVGHTSMGCVIKIKL